jgi:hypothetical protein
LLPAPPSLPPASSPPHAIATMEPYGFAGAQLGMSLEDWRNAENKASAAACLPTGGGDHLLICRGKALPLGGEFLAREPTYTFKDSRLVRITFKTSINGFSFATAVLKRHFGEPKSIKRDTTKAGDGLVLAHVLMTWSNGRSTIKLSDPTPDVTVSVDFQLNDVVNARPHPKSVR